MEDEYECYSLTQLIDEFDERSLELPVITKSNYKNGLYRFDTRYNFEVAGRVRSCKIGCIDTTSSAAMERIFKTILNKINFSNELSKEETK